MMGDPGELSRHWEEGRGAALLGHRRRR